MSSPYAYMRKSSIRNHATDISPETQEREVRALASRHGDNGDNLTLLADWDISGRGQYTNRRTDYLRLVHAIESGQCSAVYSYSLSRLGRSVTELSRFFDLCHQHDVPVRLVADSVDTSTASGRLLANVLGSVAQFEADVASERVRAMYATKRARGQDIRTSRRYGEQKTLSDGTIKGVDEDGDLVLRLFRETGTYASTARHLNEMGVPSRSGKQWWASSVAAVVHRLDPQTAQRQPATRGIASTGVAFVLTRLLRCPTCGKTLTGSHLKWPGRDERRTRYACRFGESSPHPRVSIGENLILPDIRAEADRLLPPDAVRMEQADAAERADLDQRRTRVNDMYEAGHIDKPEYERRIENIDTAINRLDSQRVMMNVPTIDWSWEPRVINRVLHAIFEEIALDPQTFRPIAYKWRVPEWRRPD